MTDSNRRQDNMNQREQDRDALDRDLDAALAKYAMAEPRAGLERRILANLRAEQEHAAEKIWWRWPALGVFAALVIIVTVSLVWKSGPVQNITAQHLPATAQTNEPAGTRVSSNGESGPIRPHEPGSRKLSNAHSVGRQPRAVIVALKLDQFPSPQPLSEQETILARYITNYPEHAALIAQARTEELRRDSAEEMGETGLTGNENSQQRNK
jgi:hypothetical protein